jgi:oligogalacturonide lyase
MDIKTGQNWLVTEAAELAVPSLVLLPDERHVAYFDGRWLVRVSLRNYKARRVYEIPAGYERGEGPAVSSDGRRAAFVEVSGNRSRLRLADLASGRTATVLEREGVLSQPLVRPRSAMILVRTEEGELLLTDFGGRSVRRLAVAAGRTGQALFTRDGESLLYLNYPPDPKQLHGLRELVIDTGQDSLVAKTSQFVAFTANRNASVFAGASGTKASPHILLLLRVTGRELTVCEHKSSAPARANLTFSPDSRWLFFESDREGKPAVYGIPVGEFVENTDA